MNLIGNFSTSSVCGKRKIIAKQRDKLLSKQKSIDVYLECKDCASIPIWDTKTKGRNQNLWIIIRRCHFYAEIFLFLLSNFEESLALPKTFHNPYQSI